MGACFCLYHFVFHMLCAHVCFCSMTGGKFPLTQLPAIQFYALSKRLPVKTKVQLLKTNSRARRLVTDHGCWLMVDGIAFRGVNSVECSLYNENRNLLRLGSVQGMHVDTDGSKQTALSLIRFLQRRHAIIRGVGVHFSDKEYLASVIHDLFSAVSPSLTWLNIHAERLHCCYLDALATCHNLTALFIRLGPLFIRSGPIRCSVRWNPDELAVALRNLPNLTEVHLWNMNPRDCSTEQLLALFDPAVHRLERLSLRNSGQAVTTFFQVRFARFSWPLRR